MALIFLNTVKSDQKNTEKLLAYFAEIVPQHNVTYDHRRHGNTKWWAALLEEIAACDLFVYLVSARSLKSTYCHALLREAQRLRKPILRVIVNTNVTLDVAPKDIRQSLTKTPSVNLSIDRDDIRQVLLTRLTELWHAWPAEIPAPLSLETPSIPRLAFSDRMGSTNRGAAALTGAVVGAIAFGSGLVPLDLSGSTGAPASATAVSVLPTPTATLLYTVEPTVVHLHTAEPTATPRQVAVAEPAETAAEEPTDSPTQSFAATATATEPTNTPEPSRTATAIPPSDTPVTRTVSATASSTAPSTVSATTSATASATTEPSRTTTATPVPANTVTLTPTRTVTITTVSDTDGDGIPDSDDACPDAPGVDNAGCPYTGRVESSVNARQGPGTTYTVLTVVNPGDTFFIVGRNAAADWLQIQMDKSDGREITAWIAEFLVFTDGTINELPVTWTD